MPWKETCVMDLRTEFVLRALREELPFTTLCQEYGISPKTGYKWKERFLQEGLDGLQDQSRRPRRQSARLDEETTCRLVRFKSAHPAWGPRKVLELYARRFPQASRPSLSTVKRVLDKAGLVVHRRRRRPHQCGRLAQRIDAQRPNQVWTVDFKGWWYSADQRRVEPLTVRDAYSRYVLESHVLKDSGWETVRERFVRLFTQYGLPEVIRSDNGSPFACTRAPLGLSRLSAWWVSLGITLDRIRPGHPEENGAHERLHKDIALEVQGVADGDVSNHQAALETWRRTFNHERPHEALGMRTPAEVYVPSTHRYDPAPVALTYPAGYWCRKASSTGSVRLENHHLYISLAVAGWELGFKPTGTDHYSVWFGPLCLGEVDLEADVFRPA